MAAVAPYTTGTAAVTGGSAVVTGTGTVWNIGVVNGGVFSRAGFSIPILSVDSATQITLAYNAPAGMAGTGVYAIDLARAGAADAVTANARLAQLVAQLQGISAFAQTILDDASASAVLDTLGVSAFIKTLLNDADQSTALATLGALPSSSYTAADVVSKLAGSSSIGAQGAIGLRGPTVTIADDASQAYVNTQIPGFTTGGIMMIHGNVAGAGNAIFFFRNNSAGGSIALIGGNLVEVFSGTSGPTAATATDGMLTLHCDATGIFRIVNRRGNSYGYTIITLGGTN